MANIDWCYKKVCPPQSQTFLATTIVTATIDFIAAPIATIGNIIVLVLAWKFRSLREPCYMCVISLAVTDLLVGLIVQPVHAVFRIISYLQMNNCPLRFTYVFGSYLVFNLTIFNVALISIDRCIAVTKPYLYPDIATKRNYSIVISLMWVCLIVTTLVQRIIPLYFTVFLQAVMIVVPFVIILICYSVIYLVVLGHRRRIIKQTSSVLMRKHSVKSKIANTSVVTYTDSKQLAVSPLKQKKNKRPNTSVVIIIAVMICYTPQVILWIYRGIFGGKIVHFFLVDTWLDTIVFINSTMNPLIYCYRLPDFRAAFRRLFFKNYNPAT